MIRLTRLRHDEVFYLNPDLIERIDTHVDTVVRLTSGNEYLVVERGEEIVQRIGEFRAKVLALVPVVTIDVPGADPFAEQPDPSRTVAGALLPEGSDR